MHATAGFVKLSPLGGAHGCASLLAHSSTNFSPCCLADAMQPLQLFILLALAAVTDDAGSKLTLQDLVCGSF